MRWQGWGMGDGRVWRVSRGDKERGEYRWGGRWEVGYVR